MDIKSITPVIDGASQLSSEFTTKQEGTDFAGVLQEEITQDLDLLLEQPLPEQVSKDEEIQNKQPLTAKEGEALPDELEQSTINEVVTDPVASKQENKEMVVPIKSETPKDVLAALGLTSTALAKQTAAKEQQHAVSIESTTKPAIQQTQQTPVTVKAEINNTESDGEQVSQKVDVRVEQQNIKQQAAEQSSQNITINAPFMKAQQPMQHKLSSKDFSVVNDKLLLSINSIEGSALTTPQTASTNSVNIVNPTPITTATPTTAVLTGVKVDTPVGDPQWRESFAERVLWATNQNIKEANIRLTPEQLGPIEISVKVHQQQASILFNAQHLAVRDAIEDAMPRLREMFTDSGIQLQEVSVSDKSWSQDKDRHTHQNEEVDPANFFGHNSEVTITPLSDDKKGVVDYYA